MNIIKEILILKEKVHTLYCKLTDIITEESDPTVPYYVKQITEANINYWNQNKTDETIIITQQTNYANINDTQKTFNYNISEKVDDVANDVYILQQADIALDIRLDNVEDNVNVLQGLNYQWNGTTRKLSLFNGNNDLITDISLVSLDNEGTDFRYNPATKALELYNNDQELLDSIPVTEFVGNVGVNIDLNSNVLSLKDAAGNILDTVAFEVSNINNLQNLLNGKVDKPATDGIFVLSKIGGVFAWENVYNYAQNIGNTNLTLTSTRILSQGAFAYTHATGGYAYNITGLPDKSNDASFNTVLTQNTAGQVAKSNGKELFKGLPSLLTQAEKDAWGTAWNNQYSNSALNVYALTPIIHKNDNNVKYIILQGLNLNVNPANTSVKFIPVGNALGVGEIDVLGFQTFADGKSIIVSLYGNALTLGQYNIVIRTTSPIVQTHRTAPSFEIVSNLNEILTSGLVWGKKILGDVETSKFGASGSSFSITPDANIQALSHNGQVIASFVSGQLFPANSNFYVVLDCIFTFQQVGGFPSTTSYNIGLLQTGNNASLTNVNLVNLKVAGNSSFSVKNWQLDTVSIGGGSVVTSSAQIILIRKGSAFTGILKVGNNTQVTTKTITTEALQIGVTGTNSADSSTKFEGVISEAYIF